jgi:hypothetical protein
MFLCYLSHFLQEKPAQQMTGTGGIVVVMPEIRYDEIKIQQQLGSGAYGSVFLGECRGETVAIKKLYKTNVNQDFLTEFRKEVAIFTYVPSLHCARPRLVS